VTELETLQEKRNQISGLLHQKEAGFEGELDLKNEELVSLKTGFETAQTDIVRLEKDIIGLALERNQAS